MSGLTVTHDGDEWGATAELCCRCWRPTRFWYAPRDVALCPQCALTTSRDEVPPKPVWCAQAATRLPRRVAP